MARQLVNSLYRLTRLKSLATDFRLCSQVQAAGFGMISGEVYVVNSEQKVSSEHTFKRRSSFTMSRVAPQVKCALCFTLSPTISRMRPRKRSAYETR